MKTGFIGLGAMGLHMARNLNRKGLLTAIWNRSPDKSRNLSEETGCVVADDPAGLAGKIFVFDLEQAIRIRTGETDAEAL